MRRLNKLDLRYLLTFKEIAETGSFSEAAKRLLITQGAVSHHVTQLEQTLKTKLFKREPRGVSLTSEGIALLRQAYKLQNFLEETYKIFGLSIDEPKSIIKIFSGEVAALTILPKITESFSRLHKVEFTVHTLNALNCLNALKEGKADIVFVGSIEFDEFKYIKKIFNIHKIMEKQLVAIVPPNHFLADKTSVTLEELLDYEFVSRGYGSAIQKRLEKLIKEEHVDPKKLKTKLVFENSSSVITAVSTGLGVSIVIDVQAERFYQKGLVKILRLEVKNPLIATYMVWPKQTINPLVKEFVKYSIDTTKTQTNTHPYSNQK